MACKQLKNKYLGLTVALTAMPLKSCFECGDILLQRQLLLRTNYYYFFSVSFSLCKQTVVQSSHVAITFWKLLYCTGDWIRMHNYLIIIMTWVNCRWRGVCVCDATCDQNEVTIFMRCGSKNNNKITEMHSAMMTNDDVDDCGLNCFCIFIFEFFLI